MRPDGHFLAAAIKRSISAVVRYSRVRTEEFTVVGVDRPPVWFSTIFCLRSNITGELSSISALVTSTFRLLVRVDAPGMHRVALFAGHCGRRANGGSFFTVQAFSL